MLALLVSLWLLAFFPLRPPLYSSCVLYITGVSIISCVSAVAGVPAIVGVPDVACIPAVADVSSAVDVFSATGVSNVSVISATDSDTAFVGVLYVVGVHAVFSLLLLVSAAVGEMKKPL